MSSKNRYANRSKISEAKLKEVIKYFSLDLDAQKTAILTNLNRNTVNRYLLLARKRIAEFCEQASPFRRTPEAGNSDQFPSGTPPVFGIFQWEDKVYTEVVPDHVRKTMQAMIQGKIEAESIIHTETWRGYSGLVDLGYDKHYRVPHGRQELLRGRQNADMVESFWSFAKRRLVKFHGVPRSTFYYHLKECEFRFNHRQQDLYKVVLKMMQERPLN